MRALGRILAGWLAASAVCQAADDPPAAMASGPDYGFCTVCHGAQGNGNPAIQAPRISGIQPWYLKQELERFRDKLRGTRPGDVTGMEMQPVAMQLDDQAIQAVATYVSTFSPRTPPVTVTGNVQHGRALYTACVACHGPKGQGNDSLHAPALAGQSDWYLVTQLEHFKAGLRGFSAADVPGTQMRAAAAVLPDTVAIKDVVSYINTFRKEMK
jgi:cytochrome c oxidase subunit 2